MRKYLLIVVLLFATPALAASWTVDPLTSTLTFEAEQAGERFTGSFPRFDSVIDFDPAAPEKGKITITIDMTRVQVDGKDRQDALPTSDWFAVREFPTATFASTSVRADMGHHKDGEPQRYTAKGTLTIKGATKEIELNFHLKTTGNSTIARGETTVNRSDFGVGQGQWKSDEWVKFPVKVSFELHASK